MVAVDGEPWVSAHDLARLIGVGGRYQRLTMAVGGKLRAQLWRYGLGDAPGLHEPGRRAAWFLSEEATLYLLYGPADTWLDADSVAVRKLRLWLAREAFPTFRATELPRTVRDDLPIVIHRSKLTDVGRLAPAPPTRHARSISGRTALYRIFDAQGALLYVGISVDFLKRSGQHRVAQSWWRQVAEVRTVFYPTRKAACAAELEAIRTEHPRYNTAGVVA